MQFDCLASSARRTCNRQKRTPNLSSSCVQFVPELVRPMACLSWLVLHIEDNQLVVFYMKNISRGCVVRR